MCVCVFGPWPKKWENDFLNGCLLWFVKEEEKSEADRTISLVLLENLFI